MKIRTLAARFLVPRFFVSLYYAFKFGAKVSPRAEVEISGNLTLGRKTVVSSFTKIKASEGPLRIGRDVSIASGCMISSGEGGVEIGDDCLIGPNVTIVANVYAYDRIDVPMREQGSTSKGVRIGRNVLLGAGVRVLDGATIGDGAIIAPNAVVTGAIPENALAQGFPAKVVFTRR